MDARDSDGSVRDALERLALAAVGAVALTGERAEELVDELATRGGMRRDDVRELVGELTARWRGDAQRLGERAGVNLATLFRELGLVTRREWEELELRVAQLEHRLRLVEETPPPGSPPPPRH
jgi:polyhydroxyalkanoate synthesis regulator phasin